MKESAIGALYQFCYKKTTPNLIYDTVTFSIYIHETYCVWMHKILLSVILLVRFVTDVDF